jgi:Arc/MetJ-type ribon-helix-helix transcriptional regulator
MNYEQVVAICCRDLRRYLEYALTTTHGGVITVKMNRVMQVAPLDRRRYAMCLGAVLRRWRWSAGIYVVPRREAETLLSRFDEFCASATRNQTATVRNRRPAETVQHTARPAGEKMPLVTFHLPPALARALDTYVRRKNMTRSAVVRTAIAQLIEKYRNVETDIQYPVALAVPPIAQDELVCVTFHETRYVVELLDMYAVALQVDRSDVVRTAIRQLLDKMRVAEERATYAVV